MSTPVAAARRLVVKVGSSLVTDEGRGLDHTAVARWATQIAELKRAGKEIVLVSSGAIAEGIRRLGWAKRPSSMHELQARLAVVQMRVMQTYVASLDSLDLHGAHILIKKEDIEIHPPSLKLRRAKHFHISIFEIL